ncbi:endonuclease/exonuclease/phosphatase family protein [Nocardia sp. 2]|uniref:Endonuclease/exonuclease/phosphatase family protein n=1 Tax=Nocardia acididurans TaxID=2802282 RepID=A0ABS1LY74_9NOCA|nr:endonuclease/exonuclease/phosphatase family protein [Nocardia acididurans]MBL1073181.1 endonuclease/exonuclease/phosphatase family protein [Nocardia acididurans]
MITVATWNVLHRVHAEKWSSEIITHWPDESKRIAAITAAISQRTERVIALQEVSGDQLISLRDALPGKTFHMVGYPRIPAPRVLPPTLKDRTELLVLIIDGPAREVTGGAFHNDNGNGALVVDVDGIAVIATHVSGDGRRGEQFMQLSGLSEYRRQAVLLGDFNTDRATVAAALGPNFTVGRFAPDALPTRPRDSAATKSQHIDHVVGRSIAVRNVVVEDVAGLSDHNLVRAVVG